MKKILIGLLFFLSACHQKEPSRYEITYSNGDTEITTGWDYNINFDSGCLRIYSRGGGVIKQVCSVRSVKELKNGSENSQ